MSVSRLAAASLRAMSRYKLRSGFMMLGSLVGVAVLTLVVAIGEAAERKIVTTLRQLFGESSIGVYGRGAQHSGGPRGDAPSLTLDDLDAIARELPEVESWDPQQATRASVRYGSASAIVRVNGHSERFERVWTRTVTRGEHFDELAVRSSARVAVIGETVARTLFGDGDPLGAEIQIGSVPFRVIGVLEAYGTDMHGIDRDNEIVAPISTVMRRLMNVNTIGAARVLVPDAAQHERTAREIARVLRSRHAIAPGQPDDFTIMTPLEVRRRLGGVQRTLVLYLPLVAGVALLVGAIVAATLMLAAVNERVGEIGLRRAVGARPEDIRLQFLLETALTMLVGGAGGIVIGYVGAQIVSSRMQLGGIFSWRAVLLGMAVSAAAGLAAGVAPARRAARLHPADALR
jgi:putative ABC transport system permease protein